jgi:diguanylate cyclase (GGDEF)-like protein
MILAPLILASQMLGVVALSSSVYGAFKESDLRLLDSFAATTTTAIQNAQLHSEVQKLAITDALTHLYNRRGFSELAQREIERARRFQRPVSAIMLDLDNFKLVNDTFGHSVGDKVLQVLAERMHQSLREVDIISRHGGDEFVVLLPETDLFAACSVAERIRQNLSEPMEIENAGPLSITASLGVARGLTASTQDITSLLERADSALYSAKHNGRNRVDVG